MGLDPVEIAGLLPFEARYELRRQRWYDGPHGSWEAFDRVLERDVVVNMAWAYSDVPGFIRSARIAASFRHPGFLPVYDLGIIEGTTPFYTTPPVVEEPLGRLLRSFEGDEAPPESVFPILPLIGALRDACGALEYAHRRGLLHLSLYPDSLLIGSDYHVILDVDGWPELRPEEGVEAGRFLGRPPYLSPEQVSETGPGVGPASDVFGLGGILHVILFGTPPNHLPGRTGVIDLIRAITGRAFEPRRRGEVRPGIRSSLSRRGIDGLVGICLKALAYRSEERYPTAEDVADALDAWLGQARRSWRPWPRRR